MQHFESYIIADRHDSRSESDKKAVEFLHSLFNGLNGKFLPNAGISRTPWQGVMFQLFSILVEYSLFCFIFI